MRSRQRDAVAMFRWAIGALALITVAGRSLAATDAPKKLSVQPIAAGVYVHLGAQADASLENRGDIANIGFIVGKRCIAVIDSGGTLQIGQQLLAAIRSVSQLPICYVINTHVHPDHVFGNAAFVGPDTEFVGHSHLPAAFAARRENYLNALTRVLGDAAIGSVVVPPTILIKDTLELDLGERKLTLTAWRTSHTDGDLTVFDTASQTLWTGDLLFVERTPVIDGSVRGWLTTLDELRRQRPAHVVPGHGPVDPPWPQAIDAEAHYLNILISDVTSAQKNGRTLSQTVETAGLSERDQWLLFDNYNRRNVTACYTELEWED
jgi:quinoprotein relay system zinc metallohydrolase 2